MLTLNGRFNVANFWLVQTFYFTFDCSRADKLLTVCNQNKRFTSFQSFLKRWWRNKKFPPEKLFMLGWKYGKWEFWLKCKIHAEGYVNNINISLNNHAAKHVNRERTKRASPARPETLFSLVLLLFATDLNGLVEFFISTDEINLPQS